MDLIALEEIRRLKYRYLRAVDQKRWDLLESTLTPDAVTEYGTKTMGKPLLLNGRAEILAFMRQNLDGPGIVTFHFGGQPEIEIDGDTATGTWAFEDTIIVREHRLLIKGAAHYEDNYVRTPDNGWQISRVAYVRAFEMTHSLDDLPSLRLTTPWVDAAFIDQT
jgi:hypothetical protein